MIVSRETLADLLGCTANEIEEAVLKEEEVSGAPVKDWAIDGLSRAPVVFDVPDEYLGDEPAVSQPQSHLESARVEVAKSRKCDRDKKSILHLENAVASLALALAQGSGVATDAPENRPSHGESGPLNGLLG